MTTTLFFREGSIHKLYLSLLRSGLAVCGAELDADPLPSWTPPGSGPSESMDVRALPRLNFVQVRCRTDDAAGIARECMRFGMEIVTNPILPAARSSSPVG